MNVEKISNLIKTKRKEKGLTQEELAFKLNVTEKAVSRWETGRGTPDISLLVPLARELNISVSELLNGKEDKKEDRNIEEIVKYIDVSKSKKNKYIIYISVILYTFILFLYLWYLKVEYSNGNFLYFYELSFNFFFIISIFLINRFISSYYYDSIDDKKRMNKVSYIIALIIYIIMFFNLTIFGRNIGSSSSFNLLPFKTILGYFAFPDLYNFIVNILGNIVILMPFQFLIMKIFDIKKFNISLLIGLILSFLIEFIQFISHAGVFDIDDIILNVLGIVIIYFIVIDKYMLLFKHKDKIIIFFISLLFVLFIFEIFSLYHFGDIPTIRVLIRLIICIISLFLINYFIYKILKNYYN